MLARGKVEVEVVDEGEAERRRRALRAWLHPNQSPLTIPLLRLRALLLSLSLMQEGSLALSVSNALSCSLCL